MTVDIAETTVSTTIQTTVSTIVSVSILSYIGAVSIVKAQELTQNVLIPYVVNMLGIKEIAVTASVSATLRFN